MSLRLVIPVLLSCSFAFPTFAADNSPLSLGGKNASKAPVEINADNLEVLQQENKAIFTGHVIAVQGDVHLKSEKMTVFYKSTEPQDKITNKEKEAKASAITPENNSIQKIIVEQNVFLSTSEETASGDHGIYDLENHKIFLNDNVVLTRGQNTLKGDRLVYDFSTGKSTMNAGGNTLNSTSGKRQRVKGLFIPQSQEK